MAGSDPDGPCVARVDAGGEAISLGGRGKSWARRGNGKMPGAAKAISEYEQIAAIIPQVWEKNIYVSCGRKIILGWQDMSDAPARELHDAVRDRIRGTIPRQVMIDDFWIDLRHEIKLTKSCGRYHFGRMKEDFTTAEHQAVVVDIARRLGKMVGDAVEVVFVLDYPWEEICGQEFNKRTGSKIFSPRTLYGGTKPRQEAKPSSGGYPRGFSANNG
jgi:hypothetical protein